jgi:DNA polymerase-1
MPFFLPDDNLYDHILIDGQHLVHRAAHAYSDLDFVDENGMIISTGVIYGFLRIITQTWKRYADSGCRIVICWEGGYHHRTAMYPDYKANRKVAPEDTEKKEAMEAMFSQQKALRKILKVAGWTQARAHGFEADDALATLAHRYGGDRVAIYTGDQDLHQCVTDKVHVVSARPGQDDKTWTTKEVREKWGVGPERVPEVKALAGDGGDNIPGCPGCGLGWAKKLLADDTSVHEVLEKAGAGVLQGEYQGKSWRTPSLTKKLLANREQVLVSWELAKVVRDAPVKFEEGVQDLAVLRAVLEKLHMFSMAEGRNWQKLSEVR